MYVMMCTGPNVVSVVSPVNKYVSRPEKKY